MTLQIDTRPAASSDVLATASSEDDMPGVMRSADLLVHAAEVELEGMVLLEALGTGLPALVAEAPLSAASTLAVGDDFRFRAGDVEALARRIDRLIDHPQLLAEARQLSRVRAEGLRLEASVAKLEDIYQHVARPERVSAGGVPAGPATARRAAP